MPIGLIQVDRYLKRFSIVSPVLPNLFFLSGRGTVENGKSCYESKRFY